MRKSMLMAATIVAAGFTTSAIAADLTVGVSWSNFQEERWKTDEGAIESGTRSGRGQICLR